MKNLTINDFMDRCRIRIFNAYSDPIINARLAPFGFDEAKHLANQALYQETLQFVQNQKKESAEWTNACTAYQQALEKARSDFKSIRKKLAYWLKPDDPKAQALQLYNNNITKISDFVFTAKHFYSTLLADTDTLALLTPFGYTQEAVTGLEQELNELDTLKENREKEEGDSQYATKSRNAKLDELDEVSEQIKELGLLVFEDDEGQYLEKLSILVRS